MFVAHQTQHSIWGHWIRRSPTNESDQNDKKAHHHLLQPQNLLSTGNNELMKFSNEIFKWLFMNGVEKNALYRRWLHVYMKYTTFFLKPKVHNLGSPSSKKFPHHNNKNTVFEQCVWEHMILIIRWHIILFFFVFVLKRKEEHKLPIHWHYTWNNGKTHIDWFNPNNRNV